MKKLLWLSLYFADLTNADVVTRIVADFAVAPARAAWGLDAPRPDEHDTFLFEEIPPIGGIRAQKMRSHHLTASAAHFDPVVRGLLLFGWLFPGAAIGTHVPDEVVEHPGYAFLNHSQEMAHRRYEEIAYLTRGLLGEATPRPLLHGTAAYEARPSPAALETLRRMKALIARSLGPPEDFGDYRRIDRGFTAMDSAAAGELDAIVRNSVHQRLIHLEDFESFDLDGNDEHPEAAMSFVMFDQGVFPALVPESLEGLIAVDLVQSLRLDRLAGLCARCHQPMLLTPQQAGRARRGGKIYHADCQRQHRLGFWREYQAERRRADESSAHGRSSE